MERSFQVHFRSDLVDVGDGDGDGGDDDDGHGGGQTFPAHPGPIPRRAGIKYPVRETPHSDINVNDPSVRPQTDVF